METISSECDREDAVFITLFQLLTICHQLAHTYFNALLNRSIWILPSIAAVIFAARPSSNWAAVSKMSFALPENPSRRTSGKSI